LHFAIGWLASLATGLVWTLTALWLSWSMTLLAMAGAALLLAAMSGQRRAAAKLGVNLGQANRALQANVKDALEGIRLAKILSSERQHLALFMRTVQQLRHQQLASTMVGYRVHGLTHFWGAFILVVFLYLGLEYSVLPIAELLILVLIFARLIPLLMNSQQQFHHALHAWPALVEAQSYLSECDEYAEPEQGQLIGQCARTLSQGVCLLQVTVRYAGREQAALNAVSLDLPARTTTALIGPSGSGKSTLADLLMALLLPDSGEVRIDGMALSPANRMGWRRSVAYVAQDVFLFQGTIRQNLLLACPQAAEADCVRALEMAAAEFVFDLPLGLDTLVGDGGVRLSGGERQRIALARALLGRPSLLILDEATSALDSDNEMRVRRVLQVLRGKVTILVIGHRLSMLEVADQVVVLEQGRVRMQGTWQEVQAILTN
jgi:ATP-binding cassette subfamily C protein